MVEDESLPQVDWGKYNILLRFPNLVTYNLGNILFKHQEVKMTALRVDIEALQESYIFTCLKDGEDAK